MNRIPLLLTLFVVAISSTASAQVELPQRLRKAFWTQGREMRAAFQDVIKTSRKSTVRLFDDEDGVAYGTIVDENGWVITKASQIGQDTLCELSDGRRVSTEVVGFDADLDLALLKLPRGNYTPVEWATVEPQIGDWMITAGTESTPIGIGVLSALRRKISKVNTYGVLGIELTPDDSAVIEKVFPDSGAERAGLKPNDLVRKVDEKVIAGRRHLVLTIQKYQPGDTVRLEVQRSGKTMELSVTLSHPFGDFLSRIAFQQQLGGPLSLRRDGFEAVYQHDTVLQPEQCGGPVVNLDGKVVGINIARAGRTTSFLLPTDLLLPKIAQMKAGESAPYGIREPGATSAD